MKAIDYYNKYHDGLLSPAADTQSKAISAFVIELSQESQKMMSDRGGKSASALAGVIRELNQKYNAVMCLFQKKDGTAPMIQDGFLAFWKREVPELNIIMAARRMQRV